jgi:hypothetical protein
MSQNSHERQPAWEMLKPVEKASSNRHLAEGALARRLLRVGNGHSHRSNH